MSVKVIPDSLFGRLLTALVVAIGVTLLVIVALLLRERRDSLFVGSDAAAIVNAIDTTAEQLAALPAAARAEEIERLRREPPAVERTASSRPSRFPAEDAAEGARLLTGRLARALGSAYEIEVRPAAPGRADVIRLGARAAVRATRAGR